MDSQFKRFRAAFGPGPQPTPQAQLASSMQTSPDPGTQYADPSGPGPQSLKMNTYDIPQRPAIFNMDNSVNQAPTDIAPVLDEAMARGQQADATAASAKAARGERNRAMIQGGIQGFAASGAGDPNVNFGQAFSRGLGVASAGVQGSMETQAARREAEEDRARSIDEMFFQRSTKLQELSIARKKAEAESTNFLVAHNDRDAALQLRSRGIDVAGRRNDLMESGQAETAQHDRAVETALLTNAQAHKLSAGAAAKKAAATKPRSKSEVDAYSSKGTYQQYGAMDAAGNIIDKDKKAFVDAQLARPSRRANQVQQTYNKLRAEATKSTVDPSADDADAEDDGSTY